MIVIKKKKPEAVPGPGRQLRIDWTKPAQFTVPIPRDETQRLAALVRYDILDTPAEENFDNITVLASHICDTPVALIVLIDHDRQWFKATVGTRLKETPRAYAFCAYTIMQRELLVIPDAARDPRFRNHPFVSAGPKFRFYAGAPLVTPDNRALGTLCVIDTMPRHLTSLQKKDLTALSRLVMTELELRRSLREKRRESRRLLALPAARQKRDETDG
jgi:GAF domain-containing protein